MPINEESAGRAYDAIMEAYRVLDVQQADTERLMADIMHLCDQEGFCFKSLLSRAAFKYGCEKAKP